MSRPATKKTAIEKAAIRLFARKGVMQTTVKDIAQEAGVTEGALYRHYPSKEDMAWRLFLQELSRFTPGLKDILSERGKSIHARMADAVRYTLAYNETLPEELAYVLLSRHSFSAELYVTEHDNPIELIRMALEQGMRSGEIAPCRADLLTAMVIGVVLHPIELQRYREITGAQPFDVPDKDLIIQSCLALLPTVSENAPTEIRTR